MKRFFITLAVLLLVYPVFASSVIKFSESVLPYKGGLLISNFGSVSHRVKSEDENNGYILYYKNNKIRSFISADGNLKTPAATAVYKKKLFVCDGDRLWVYNLKKLKDTPQKIMFNKDDKAVNDILLIKDELYVTVTNTNRIYKINLKSKDLKPEKWVDIPSPNGIANKGKTIYVASIPADYTHIKDENVIYIIKNKDNPVVEKFTKTPGMYDGIAVTGKKIYVSDWAHQAVKSIDIKTRKEKIIYQQSGMGPADIALKGNKLYIPDLLNHRIIILDLKNYSVKEIENN